MSPEVTHVVAEVESDMQSQVGSDASSDSVFIYGNELMCVCSSLDQELRDLCGRFPGAAPVQKDWLNLCFSKQRRVDAGAFLHPL